MTEAIEKQINLAIEQMLNSKNIYIVSHVQPDGDNLGSILSLGQALKSKNLDVFMLKSDEIPNDFMFLPGIEYMMDYDGLGYVDVLIVLDSGDENRIGKNKEILGKANLVINIDHHISNTYFGDINIVDKDASSTGELVFEIIKSMGIEISKEIGTCLYTAISSDTGSFMYDNTSARTHEIAAELLKSNIDKSYININLYQNRSLERTKLFITALNSLELYYNDKVAIVAITQELLEKSNATMEDTEGIVSFLREISPVEVAIILKEFHGENIKVSMRSKKYVDVAKISSYFSGGGHVRAAGFTVNSTVGKIKASLLEQLKDYI
ncbi:MAG: bifunctional oligoribonuclease/PAP phosphatase NrnA [Tissierellaceae bacterium]|nr:bifunctional oligoribonuclease/PAP phosphatase NrnA [Tissierellaceae bacterium]